MVEIAFVALTALLAMKLHCENVLVMLVFLLPFNDFLKNIVSILGWGDGGVFSFWKEFVILILFFRSIHNVPKRMKAVTGSYVLMGVCCVFFFIIGLSNYPASICFRTLRNVCMTPLLFVICSALIVSASLLRKILAAFCIDIIIIGLIGIWEIHFDGRLPLRAFMGDISIENASGVFYNVPNFKIMGIDRMCSIMGTPNSFGYLMAMGLSFTLFLLMYKGQILNAWQKKAVLIVCLLSLFCLLESFCRTAYVMVVWCYFFVLYYKQRHKFIRQFSRFCIIVSILFIIICIISPNIIEVLQNTLNGNEASAADRYNNFSSGWMFAISHPWGYGLGSSENSVDGYIYFSESSFINMITEIGMFGLFIFYVFQFALFRCMHHKSDWYAFSLSFLLVNLITMLSTNIFGTPYIYMIYIFTGLCMMKPNIAPSYRLSS